MLRCMGEICKAEIQSKDDNDRHKLDPRMRLRSRQYDLQEGEDGVQSVFGNV